MAKKNTLKKPAKNTVKTDKKESPKKAKGPGAINRFFRSERTHRMLGLFLILLAIYCTIAFTSFLFTWKIDQSILSGSWGELIASSTIEAENWLGKIGAMLSHVFIHQWFGLGSFLFVLLFFIAGFKLLFKTYLLPPAKTLRYSIFGMLIISLAMAFIFSAENMRFMGGSFGYQLNQWLVANIGTAGAGILILFILTGFIIVAFNPSLAFLHALKVRFGNKLAAENGMDINARESDFDDNQEKDFKDTLGEMDDFSTSAADLILKDDTDESEEEDEIVSGNELGIEMEDNFPYPEKGDENEEGSIELDTHVDPAPEKDETEEEEFEVAAATTEKELSEKELSSKVQEFGEYDPTLDLSNYQMPKLDMLVDYGGGKITVSKEELEENKNKIVTTLGNYKIGIEKIKAAY